MERGKAREVAQEIAGEKNGAQGGSPNGSAWMQAASPVCLRRLEMDAENGFRGEERPPLLFTHRSRCSGLDLRELNAPPGLLALAPVLHHLSKRLRLRVRGG